MRVITEQSQEFDFGLTGQETQDTFNLEKYKELAYGSPRGAELARLVDERWLQWLRIVGDAPWLRNWNKSLLKVGGMVDGLTPLGRPLSALMVDGVDGRGVDDSGALRVDEGIPRIAYSLYAEAVWGYGIFGWLDRGPDGKLKRGAVGTDSRVKSNSALRCIWRLQNVKLPSTTRKYMFDDAIYRGTGLMIPCEFGDLDRWLEPLWFEACQV